MAMVYQTVEVEVNLGDFETDDLIEELQQRSELIGNEWGDPTENKQLITDIFYKRRAGQDFSRELDNLIYNAIGRFE